MKGQENFAEFRDFSAFEYTAFFADRPDCAVCRLQKAAEIPLFCAADLFGGMYAGLVLRRAAGPVEQR